jgi:hypothetical protein
MKSLSHFAGTIAALKRHKWMCLFLAFSLLYNPFLVAPRSAGGFELCHPASYRATVGASELQHFAPTDGWVNLPAAETAVAKLIASSLELSAESSFVLPLAAIPVQQFFGSGLWFRPPPAL